MALQLKPNKRDAAPELSPVLSEELSPESFRQLYVSLDLALDSHPVIGVTSAIAGEGRTTVALGLARTLAKDLNSIVSLVEVDLERPTLAERFDVGTSDGLADVLRGERHLADVRCLLAPNLYLIPGGTERGDAATLLHQLPVQDPFRQRFPPQDPFSGTVDFDDLVILDLPPVLSHGYSALAASIADVLVLVVRAGVTPVDVVREAISRLDDPPPRGVVLNGPRSALPSWWSG